MLVVRIIFPVVLLYAFSNPLFAQILLKGVVKDRNDNPIFPANISLKSNSHVHMLTDLDGQFELPINNVNDTLMISAVYYKSQQIILKNYALEHPLIIRLKTNSRSLAEVIITAKEPISEYFSVVQLTKLDVYLNPASQGDPLKAVNFLPSSTTTDESANPSFRGSAIDRTRVVFNGVPIYQPVRNTQINKIGGFSIFSPDLIDKEYVYASNPPLTYGNASSGLIEIKTISELTNNQVQFSATLSNLDLFLSQKLGEGSFTQIFGNYQFSGPFVKLNNANIKSFETKNIGINFHTKFSKKLEFNSFSYLIDEGYDAFAEAYTYTGESISSKKRFFMINNLMYYSDQGVLSVHTNFDVANKLFSFGNINSNKKLAQTYAAINYKKRVYNNLSVQVGLCHDYQENKFDNIGPLYFYAQAPQSPKEKQETNLYNHNLEGYVYSNLDLGTRFAMFSGLRSNIPINKQTSYLSSQIGLKYAISNDQSVSVSGGNYHNYSLPDFFNLQFKLLESSQAALEYTYKRKKTLVKAASFYTNETGQQATDAFQNILQTNILGVECFYEQNIKKYWKLTLANTYLHQLLDLDGTNYRGDKSFKFFIKASFGYSNPKLFSSSISYIGRPGSYYTPVMGSIPHAATGNYLEPQFSKPYSQKYGNYNRFDLSVNKQIHIKNALLTCFFTVNNIFNSSNESSVYYSSDYVTSNPSYYPLRTWYFGLIWTLNY